MGGYVTEKPKMSIAHMLRDCPSEIDFVTPLKKLTFELYVQIIKSQTWTYTWAAIMDS